MADDLERRVAERAYRIWEREGRPDGRSAEHWDMAREEIAIEDNQRDTLRPNPSHGPDDTAERTEPVEPALSVEALGDLPGLTDQGEEMIIPGREGPTPLPEPHPADGTAVAVAAPAAEKPARRPKRRSAG